MTSVVGFRTDFSVKFQFFFGSPDRKTRPFGFRLKPETEKPESSVFQLTETENRKFRLTDNTVCDLTQICDQICIQISQEKNPLHF